MVNLVELVEHCGPTRVVQLGDPGARVSGADEVCCGPGHRQISLIVFLSFFTPGDCLVGANQEASTARPVLLLHPAIRATVGVLGGNEANQANGKQKEQLHCGDYWT